MLPFWSVAIATTPGTRGVPDTTLCRIASAAAFRPLLIAFPALLTQRAGAPGRHHRETCADTGPQSTGTRSRVAERGPRSALIATSRKRRLSRDGHGVPHAQDRL